MNEDGKCVCPLFSFSLGPDYHWYRQDSNGSWSSKHGGLPVGSSQVTDPGADAAAWGYTTECSAMCARNQ